MNELLVLMNHFSNVIFNGIKYCLIVSGLFLGLLLLISFPTAPSDLTNNEDFNWLYIIHLTLFLYTVGKEYSV